MNIRQFIKRSIGENLANKEQILSAVLMNSRTRAHSNDYVDQTNGGYVMKRLAKKWSRKALTVAAAVILIMTASIVAYAFSAKTATLSLSLSNETVSPEESISLTVSATSKTGLSKGIVGLTMDVEFNADILTFDEVTPTLDSNKFETSANEWETGKIRVLVYSNAFDTDTRFFAAGDDLFSLAFTVKKDASTGTINDAFAVTDCDLADYTGDEGAPASDNGFELITVNNLPTKNLTISSDVVAYTGTLHFANGTTEVLTANENGLLDITNKNDSKDGHAFTGWYTDPTFETPFDTTKALIENINLYSNFVSVTDVTVETTDEFTNDTRGFGVLGTQIRTSDNSLRFVSRISKALIAGFEKDGDVIEYGTTLVSENYFNSGGGGYNGGNPLDLLKGDGSSTAVNKNTVTNVSAEKIYNDFDDYYRYTAVLTGMSTDKQKSTRFCARAYITYEDANGIQRTYYATENDNEDGDGNYKTGYGAYWKSLDQANADLQ